MRSAKRYSSRNFLIYLCTSLLLALVAVAGFTAQVFADETCMSPYMAKIVGQEDFVYVWTLGSKGVGDEQDKLVTIDVNPKPENYGKVVESLSVGDRNEAHHSGLTDDRRYLWAGGLDTSKIFIFDVHSDPAKPVQLQETKIGAQINMASQSWDGKRIYFTSSLLANWDKVEAPEGEELQYFKAYSWDGKQLQEQFSIDFIGAKLGLPHQMRFGAYSLYGISDPRAPQQ